MTVDHPRTSWSTFLKDVFIVSLGAYGGPEAHYGVITDQMIIKKKYISEEDLVELIALCTFLPGPSSTQTIVSIGYKIGGPTLAFLTLLVWALPVLTVMTLLSFLGQFLQEHHLSTNALRYIGPMAVGFIVVAAINIGRKVLSDSMTWILFALAVVLAYFLKSPWVFPSLLILGGLISVLRSRETNLWNKVRLTPPWGYFVAFLGFAFGALLLRALSDNRIVQLFESFYRYGYLVIGGGQVVVPLMHTELVEINQYMTNQEFLTGYGLVQGLPGPMFSFSAYAGGMAARGGSMLFQLAGSIVGGIGIFLPGVLLIFFVYPVWENLKQMRGIKVSLKGVNAVAAGFIAAAAITLMQKSGFAWDNIIVTAISILILWTKKVPAPILVLLTLVAGFLIPVL